MTAPDRGDTMGDIDTAYYAGLREKTNAEIAGGFPSV